MKLLDSLSKNLIFNSENVKNSECYLIYKTLFNQLGETKNKIDQNYNEWDKMKKLSNPYELIHVSYCKDKKYISISAYQPLSRSYFKMIEMIQDYDLLNFNENINVACLAEGPGGFMEAIYNYRSTNNINIPNNKKINKKFNDNIYGITLAPTDQYIPGWKKIQKSVFNFKIFYGNLYKNEDILGFSESVGCKMKLITADGGFDYSSDFNNQERQSHRIIFSEIIGALTLQDKGGHFVCKIFDIFTILTIQLIKLIYCFYDEVYIVKPKSSRCANSEKYLIAKGFRGIDDKTLEKLLDIHKNWNDNTDLGIKVENEFIHSLYQFNCDYIKKQIFYINLTLDFIKNRPEKNKYRKLINEQVENAKTWCKTYGIKINYESKYFTLF